MIDYLKNTLFYIRLGVLRSLGFGRNGSDEMMRNQVVTLESNIYTNSQTKVTTLEHFLVETKLMAFYPLSRNILS